MNENDIIKVLIGKYEWSVRFLPQAIIGDRIQGYTWTNKRCIDILNDLDYIGTKITITHEVVHALLDTQGRCFQRQFKLEDVCEFISWNIDEINNIVAIILEARGRCLSKKS